jgi:hypothetical protein
MTVSNHLYLLAIGLVVIGWETRVYAEGDVTIYTPPPAVTNAPTDGALAADGTPIVHKSLHKKKASDSQAIASTTGTSTPSTGTKPVTPTLSTSTTSISPPTPAKTTPAAYWAPSPNPVQTATTPLKSPSPTSFGPPVETGLPVARHTHIDNATMIDPAPIPISATLPAVTYTPGTTSSQPPSPTSTPASTAASRTVLASAISALPEITSDPSPGHTSKKYADSTKDSPLPSVRKGPKNNYPWKTNIITTIFWIGEGSTPISSTTNEASAWDEDWRSSNSGSDSPYDRNGYASGRHAATVNPFYIALPFNDLAFPDKANRWLPAGWSRPSRNGRQVSACKDRWVEIKVEDGTGRTCYAQWEDVGPLRYDHAEYVFGSQRPDTYTRAGLDVSPAVAQYLSVNEKNRLTRWRFVDDEDVPPGVWLKYDEQAVLYKALHELKNTTVSRNLPIQRATAPIDDSTSDDSNKKKIGAAKG